jgi:hypothetical protein
MGEETKATEPVEPQMPVDGNDNSPDTLDDGKNEPTDGTPGTPGDEQPTQPPAHATFKVDVATKRFLIELPIYTSRWEAKGFMMWAMEQLDIFYIRFAQEQKANQDKGLVKPGGAVARGIRNFRNKWS